MKKSGEKTKTKNLTKLKLKNNNTNLSYSNLPKKRAKPLIYRWQRYFDNLTIKLSKYHRKNCL